MADQSYLQSCLSVERMSVIAASDEPSREALLASPPDWEPFVRAGLVTDKTLSLVREYAYQPEESTQELLESEGNGKQYANALVSILRDVSNPKVSAYVVTLVEDLLVPNLTQRALLFEEEGHHGSTDLLTGRPSDAEVFPPLVIEPFSRLLDSESAYTRCKAMYVMAMLLSVRPQPSDALFKLVDMLLAELSRSASAQNNSNDTTNQFPKADQTHALVRCLSVVLRHPQGQAQVFKNGGLRVLLSLIRSKAGKMQLLYELSLCVWQLAMYPPAMGAFDHSAMHDLVKLIQQEPGKKALRMALATTRLILDDEEREKEISEALIERGMLKILENKCNQTDDPEMQDNVQAISTKLANNYRVLNTFERYKQELLTSELEWGTIHTEKFWKENVRKFEADDFGCIHKLVALMKGEDTVTAAVACNDIGFFVQLYPNGKAIVERMGGKSAVMLLLTHADADVQKQALLCCSKLMVTKWEFLGM